MLTPRRLNIPFHTSDKNFGSRSDMIARGTPQSVRPFNNNLAHSAASNVDFPGINAIRLLNLSVTVRMQSCPWQSGSPRMKSIPIVSNGLAGVWIGRS